MAVQKQRIFSILNSTQADLRNYRGGCIENRENIIIVQSDSN